MLYFVRKIHAHAHEPYLSQTDQAICIHLLALPWNCERLTIRPTILLCEAADQVSSDLAGSSGCHNE